MAYPPPRAKFQRSRKFSQKRRPEDNDDFLWLISLSDLMILLFIFFVVLFSFSHDKLKRVDVERILASLRNEPLPEHPIERVENTLKEWIAQESLDANIHLEKDGSNLLIVMKDTVLFQSGAPSPHTEGASLIRALKQTLESVPAPYRIGIEGHTDDSPIHTDTIADNWDLSAKRALSVLHTLSLSPETLSRTVLMAYGKQNPLVPNRDAQGTPIAANQAQNRRVTIRIY